MPTAPRIHRVTQYKSVVAGIEAMTLVSNHHFPRHSHDQFGLGVVVSGAQRSWSAIGAVTAEAGDIVMVNPGELHDGLPFHNAPRTWRMIYIDPDLLHSQLREETTKAIEILRPVARDPLLAQRFSTFFNRLTALVPDSFAIDESLLRTLLGMAFRHGTVRPSAIYRSTSARKAIQRIDSDPAAAISLAELASLSGVSRFQLLRGFVREVGITPHAYLVQQRVRLARRLLSKGLSPAETAAQAGFADQSHLTRAFVSRFGVTPGRFRACLGCNFVQDSERTVSAV